MCNGVFLLRLHFFNYSNFGNYIIKTLFMKSLRLLFASLTFCFLFIGQSDAQTITNLTPCWFQVKANINPAGACTPSGFGPLFGVPGGAIILVTVPTSPPQWIVSYGVKRYGVPVQIPGEPTCGFGASYNVGTCLGMPVYASYLVENLTIHF